MHRNMHNCQYLFEMVTSPPVIAKAFYIFLHLGKLFEKLIYEVHVYVCLLHVIIMFKLT
jgi:hypothetical protein